MVLVIKSDTLDNVAITSTDMLLIFNVTFSGVTTAQKCSKFTQKKKGLAQ